jgi:tetratricopeptide (TPR) repeat protein
MKSPNRPRDWRSALPGLLLGALVLVVYLPSLSGEFLWDDDSNVTKRGPLRSLAGLWRIWFQPGATQQYYPLTHTSFWLDYHVWGLNPFGYHLENVILHALSAILLWLILRRLKVKGTWLGAALFALHPVGVESVAWITERKNTLSAFFFLGAMLASLEFWLPEQTKSAGRLTQTGLSPDEPYGPRKFYWLTFALYLCALWAKTATVALPVIVLLLLWWKRGGFARRSLALLVPFFAAGTAMGLITMWVERHDLGATGLEWAGISRLERGLIGARALWFYLGRLVWPHPLMFMYPRWTVRADDPRAYIPLVAAIAVLLLLWRNRHGWGRPSLFVAAYFVCMLFPVLGFFNGVFFLYSFVCDHFQYLACIAPLALVAAVITLGLESARPTKPWLEPSVCGVLLLSLGILTWRQTAIYHDPDALWADTLAHNPNSWMAHDNLGTRLANAGQFGEANAHYRNALELRPEDHMAYNNLGLNAARQGNAAEAVQYFSKALEIFPGYALGHFNLGRVLATQGNLDQAIAHFSRALELDPEYSPAHFSLANALAAKGNATEAISHYRRALELDPNFAPAHASLGRLLAAQGKPAEAIEQYRQALAIDPRSVEALANLANALVRENQFADAIEYFRAALELDPTSPVLHYNLAVALDRQGQKSAAQQELAKARQLQAGHELPASAPPDRSP